jgi:hypothetical protein
MMMMITIIMLQFFQATRVRNMMMTLSFSILVCLLSLVGGWGGSLLHVFSVVSVVR